MRCVVSSAVTLCTILTCSFAGLAQEWTAYGGDPGGTRHSNLRQIDKTNVARLQKAWTFDTGDVSDGSTLPSRTAFETTPLVIGGVLYLTTPFCRVIALNPETGEQLWAFDPQIDKSVRMNLLLNRGVSYWTDAKGKGRLLLGDLHGRLWSLDPKTGKPDPAFGTGGHVDLATPELANFPGNQYRITSPPAVCKDTVITGALVSDGAPQGPSGDIRAFNVSTGRERWRFHVVPRAKEKGIETWETPGSNENRGGANAWAPFAVDEKLGLVFAPTTSPSYDFFGGDRKGANLFGNSVLALDCETGSRRWHFQTVHHDIWDYDLPAQPTLVTVRRGAGREVTGVAQVTKMGFVFVLDRETGRPLFDVVEKKFPPSKVAGEQAWPTQPIPSKPAPVARQSMKAGEVTNVTPESRAECMELLDGVKTVTSIYDPLGESPQVLFPGLNGGTNWGGASFDPATQTLFVNTMDVGGVFRLVPRSAQSKIPFALRGKGPEFFWDSHRYPCQSPPWGSLYAIDLNTGAFRWRTTLGEFDELTARGIPPTGAPNIGGSIVTAGGLIFIAATNDRKFRAFDKDTGAQLWMTRLPASGLATPATYVGPRNGKQYVVIAAGGGNKYDSAYSGQIIAYALP